MDHYGILSIVPPILAIVLALKTKKYYRIVILRLIFWRHRVSWLESCCGFRQFDS